MADLVENGVMGEDGWGSRGYNSPTTFTYIADKKERRAAVARQKERHERWQRAMERRAEWTPEQFAAEEDRIAAQIEEWERNRDAA